jgi:hypothetical protein
LVAFNVLSQQDSGGNPLTADIRAEAHRLANIAAQIDSEDAFVLARCVPYSHASRDEFDRGAAMVEKALSLNPTLAVARFSMIRFIIAMGEAS